MRSPDVVVEYRRAQPPRFLAATKLRDDDPPPRPGGVPMRLRAERPFVDGRGITERRGRIRSWRAAS